MRASGLLCALCLALLAGTSTPLHADSITLFPVREVDERSQQRFEEGTLTIYGATDLVFMQPLIEAFQQRHPRVAVRYDELPSLALYNRLLDEVQEQGHASADLVLSSAMDLQVKLANDGFALPYVSSEPLPEWSTWRNEVFGFSNEPAVIVYNKTLLAPQEVPHTRQELIDLLVAQPERLRGRIATYDLERSGVGFLFATQDARRSPVFWSLVERLGRVDVQLYETSGEVLDAVAEGRALLGYNVVGSYARAWAERHPQLGIVLPRDYTLVMSRLVLIPRSAPQKRLAQLFLDFLLGIEGQRVVAGPAHLYAVHPAVEGEATTSHLRAELGAALNPIQVGPGLLVYLDQAKRRTFLRRWQRALEAR